ncbi:Uncharacterised protein [Vibrio cholerae]|nr:Uncharacterised protein [Vibrio cholerae]CSB90468.1 Uncharacterised protein [Vibrio cholerae]CSC51571.1 Uncharacterised protein [Vibrio cholerae]CSD36663.1 Uncharacterised protein [Vibrio cholerae]
MPVTIPRNQKQHAEIRERNGNYQPTLHQTSLLLRNEKSLSIERLLLKRGCFLNSISTT